MSPSPPSGTFRSCSPASGTGTKTRQHRASGSIAFGFGGGCAPQLLSFAVALRSIISFSSERLERITFYEVDEDDAARIDREGGIRQKLCQLAHEIHWKERNYGSDVVDGDDGSSSYDDEGFDEEDNDDDI